MVKKLWTKGFRNLEENVIEFSENEVCFIWGDNNQGKTNFLESLYVLGNGATPSGKSLENLVNFNNQEAILGGDIYLDRPYQESKKRVYLKVSKSGDSTSVINNKPLKSLSELKSVLNIDFLSADVLHVFQENAGYRRKVLDRFCSRLFTHYHVTLKRYERVLSQKNTVLKSGCKHEELAIFNRQLIDLGSKIYKYRTESLQHIEIILKELIPLLILDSVKKTKCNYIIHKQNVLLQELSYQDWIEDQFLKTQKKERELGFSIVGIHRDDFDIELDGKHLYSFYSRGINRAVAILVNVAQLISLKKERGAAPVLLLDDTFSEIDATIKKRIVSFLENKAQLFYCSVIKEDKDLFKKVKVLTIKKGRVEECLT